MKRNSITTIAIVGTMLAVTPAFAVTVSNRNAGEQTLTVDQGTTQADQKIAAGASATVACPTGCELRVRGSGYGRSAGSDDALLIDDQGLIRFANEVEVTGSINASAKDKTAK